MYYVASNGIKTAVISPDHFPENPRDPDYQENLTHMICWHSRHNLGDEHDYKEPRDFAVDMVEKYLKPMNVFKAMANGELADFRLIDNADGGDYLVDARIGLVPGQEKWERMDWKVSREFEVVEAQDSSFDLEMDVLDNCWPAELLRMCEKYGDVAVMPLHLYDHSGISISTSSFVGRAPHADWDSGQVGYIYLDKETAMKELAMEGDKIRLAMPVPYAESMKLSRDPSIFKLEDNMSKLGYAPVRAEDIRNIEASRHNGPANQPIIDPSWARDGLLFKKDRTLYVFESYNPDNTLNILPVATFNPDLMPLSEETWRTRAEEVMLGDVKEYDNYLTGEIYGYQMFEGLTEKESCWGFNPGNEEILDLMNTELNGWFGSKMNFEPVYDGEFDIDNFFYDHEFPELKAKILQDVKDFIAFEAETSTVYPFALSAEVLLANTDSILDRIVDELYDTHSEYSTDDIFASVLDHAGASRSVQPKLSVADLDPDKDYTVGEIMEVFKKKPSLNELIANAAGRSASQEAGQPGKNLEHNRS